MVKRKTEKEANMGEDDTFNFENGELKVSMTSCQALWEKVGWAGF